MQYKSITIIGIPKNVFQSIKLMAYHAWKGTILVQLSDTRGSGAECVKHGFL